MKRYSRGWGLWSECVVCIVTLPCRCQVFLGDQCIFSIFRSVVRIPVHCSFFKKNWFSHVNIFPPKLTKWTISPLTCNDILKDCMYYLSCSIAANSVASVIVRFHFPLPIDNFSWNKLRHIFAISKRLITDLARRTVSNSVKSACVTKTNKICVVWLCDVGNLERDLVRN